MVVPKGQSEALVSLPRNEEMNPVAYTCQQVIDSCQPKSQTMADGLEGGPNQSTQPVPE